MNALCQDDRRAQEEADDDAEEEGDDRDDAEERSDDEGSEIQLGDDLFSDAASDLGAPDGSGQVFAGDRRNWG